jgi:hypothetical protein
LSLTVKPSGIGVLSLNGLQTDADYICFKLLQGSYEYKAKRKVKRIPVTGRGGLQGCEMLRIPHYLDNWLTDGGKVTSPMRRPHFTPQKYYFSDSGTHFC